MVRHGFRPWLGYAAASGQDGDIHLRQKRSVASLKADGTVVFTTPLRLPGPPPREVAAIPGDDQATFDALFPPDTPNKRNLMRRLYEIGL